MKDSLFICLLLMLGTCLAAASVQAQHFSTHLPTPQAGDHGNGAATSDVAGGVFVDNTGVQKPAISHGIPTAFGPSWRGVFAAAGIQHGLRYARNYMDGAVFGGFGVGDAEGLLALEITTAVYALVDNTAEVGSVGMKLHRRLGERTAVAAGVENFYMWGNSDGGRSAYLVASHRLPLRPDGFLHEAIFTLGVGDGRFNNEQKVRRGENEAALFGSASATLMRQIGVLVTWTGQDLNIGMSVIPLPELPFVFTPVLLDVTGHAGDGARPALSVGVGYLF